METANPCVLIVDDEENNLLLLEGVFAAQPYRLVRATSGAQALDLVEADPPDLILLDVMMPGLSGFDVCRRLKQRSETEPIPIILVTGLQDRKARIRGLEAGADDFINKPVDSSELRARVKSLLRLKAQHDALSMRYREVLQLEDMRETLIHMIIHDLRTPLMGVTGYLELYQLMGYVPEDAQAREYLKNVNSSIQVLMDMINAILDQTRLEAGEMQLHPQRLDWANLLDEVCEGMAALLKRKNLRLEKRLDQTAVVVYADAEMLRRILVNLISNAIKFTLRGGTIVVASGVAEGHVRIAVQDTGPGIPDEDQAWIFDKFKQAKGWTLKKRYSTGLGLTFCKLAVEAHGGRIGVDSQMGQGSTFWCLFPPEDAV